MTEFRNPTSCVDFACHDADEIGTGNDIEIKAAQGGELKASVKGTNSINDFGVITDEVGIKVDWAGNVSNGEGGVNCHVLSCLAGG